MEPWVQTYTGKRFELLNPRPEMIDPMDICVSLANQMRFNGHLKKFYSVAEHSFRVSLIVSDEAKPWALLHDAAETYIGDIPTPVKRAMRNLSREPLDYTKIMLEEGIARCIRRKFNIEFNGNIEKEVQQADQIMLATEARDLLPGGPIDGWTDNILALEEVLVVPLRSEQYFSFYNRGVQLGLWAFDPRDCYE